MKSPFPGMDPYVEACELWEDFHDDLIADIKRVLAETLPKGYLARTKKRCYIELVETEGKQRHPFVPDVSVTAPPGHKPTASKAATSATATLKGEPVSMRAFIDREYQEKFIDIYELHPERRLVTSIEVLSPANKRRNSIGRKKYLRKRKGLLLGKANLVEIDLLRGGERMPMVDDWPESPYALLVARADEAPHCRVWPASFASPLPEIPVPLTESASDVVLAVQPLIDSIYERNRYADEIDYATPLTPALGDDEATAVAKLLRAAKKSGAGRRAR